MHSIFYTEAALQDLSVVYDFIAESDSIYASKVIDTIYAFVSYLAVFPSLGIEMEDTQGLRLVVEPSFRYRIVYRVVDSSIRVFGISKYKNLE